MKDYEPQLSFGEDIAESYREIKRGNESSAVAFLAQLAGDGPALELAIGAGRVALPLAARGIKVDGIDIDNRYNRRLRGCGGSGNFQANIRGLELTL